MSEVTIYLLNLISMLKQKEFYWSDYKSLIVTRRGLSLVAHLFTFVTT